jgi:hypothetical protein
MDRRLVHSRLADEFCAASADTRYGEARRIDVDKSIAALRRSIRRAARTHLHASIVVFDEALQFLIHLEATLLEYARGPKAFAFATLVSRMKCLAVSFRELVLIGQADAARLIVRAFLETSELATVSMADAEFAIAYAPDDLSFDDQAFWKQNVGYGKIYPVLTSVYVQAGLSRELSEQAVKWRKGWKDDLSGAVHGAAWSAYQCAIVPSLESPGMGVAKALGHLSAHTPALCKVMLDEVSLFSEVFLQLLHSKVVPDNLKALGTGPELASTLAAADTFKELFTQLVDELVPDRNALFPEPDEASEEPEEAEPPRAGDRQ